MKKKDLAMRCLLEDVELLLFTSYQLPLPFWSKSITSFYLFHFYRLFIYHSLELVKAKKAEFSVCRVSLKGVPVGHFQTQKDFLLDFDSFCIGAMFNTSSFSCRNF